MKQYVVIFTLFLLSIPLLPVVFGSNTTVSRQSAVTFPAVDGDNEMRGFGAFEAGFTLADNSTTCLFNSFFPVSGTVNFSGGTLNLSLDLFFSNVVDIASAGRINGNGFSVILPEVIGTLNLPSTTFSHNLILNGVTLILNSDIAFKVPVQFEGNCEIHGNGHVLSLDDATGITIASGASLRIKDAIIKKVSGTKIAFASSTSTITVEDSAWWLTANYDFNTGSFTTQGDWFIFGPYIFSYNSIQTSTISSNSQIYVGFRSTFKYAPSSGNNKISMIDTTSKIFLEGATLHATTAGLQLINGSLFVDGASFLISDGTNATNGILLGNGTGSNDMTIKVFPGATLENSGFIGYKNVN